MQTNYNQPSHANFAPLPVSEEQTFLDRDSSVTTMLDRYKTTISKSLPKGWTAEKFMQIAINSIHKNPKLLQCNQMSLLMSMIEIAQLGLSADANLGECYLIPYKDKCTTVIGYRGLLKLAYRSGRVKTAQSYVVYSFDIFEIELGINRRIKHIPMFTEPRTLDKIIGFYAVVELTNGGVLWEFMVIDEVLKTRDESNNYKYAKDKTKTIWHNDFVEMGKKTPLRKLMKITPLETDVDRALEIAIAYDMEQDYNENASQEMFATLVDEEEKENMQHDISLYENQQRKIEIQEAKETTDEKVLDALSQLKNVVENKNKQM